MELTRYWRAQHNGADIEVQWTGFRLHGGWILRLLINGELKAEQKVRRYVQDFELKDGSITINFWGKLFRHRCKISADGKVLADSTQPWNALAFSVILLVPMCMICLGVLLVWRVNR